MSNDEPVSHTNCMGKTYYLHAATTRKGAVHYVMKMARTGIHLRRLAGTAKPNVCQAKRVSFEFPPGQPIS